MTTNKTVNSVPEYILMAVCDIAESDNNEAVVVFELQPKKLLKAIGFNGMEGVWAVAKTLAAQYPSAERVLISSGVNMALNLAMQQSSDWQVEHHDVFSNQEIDVLLQWPATHQPDNYADAIDYLISKSENPTTPLTIIEQMALVSTSIAGLGAFVEKHPPEQHEEMRGNTGFYINQWLSDPESALKDPAVIAMQHGILNLFPPCKTPSTSHQVTPEFSNAMQHYQDVAAKYGDDSDEARDAFDDLMLLAPDWFTDMAKQKARDMGLIPPAEGYSEDGTPVYSIEGIAKHFETSEEDALKALDKVQQARKRAGLPEIEPIDPSTVHKIQ